MFAGCRFHFEYVPSYHHVIIPLGPFPLNYSTRGPTKVLQVQVDDEMRLPLFLSALSACLPVFVSGTALTYKLAPNEKACFFAHVDTAGSKMAFYFAVSNSTSSVPVLTRSSLLYRMYCHTT